MKTTSKKIMQPTTIKSKDNGCGTAPGNLVTLIEQVELGNRVKLARREQFWQHQLRTYAENGGNAQCTQHQEGNYLKVIFTC